MTRRPTTLQDAAVGVMCATNSRAFMLDAIRSCEGHAILLSDAGLVEGATRRLAGVVAVLLDVSLPSCLDAFAAAFAAGVPIVALSFGNPSETTRALLKAWGIQAIVDPDAPTLCQALVAAVGRAQERGDA
jgi:NAD(P)H-dependent flavin oxidoreductase YrpB (nitropropane dioxygenase family)